MNKARQFEDFVLDDYDYNLLEDWDLEYLWEWVEFDDFSDLEEAFYNSQGFDPDGDNHDDEYNDDDTDTEGNDFLKSIGLLDDDHDDIADNHQNNQENDNNNEDDEYSFDFNFDVDDENEEDEEEDDEDDEGSADYNEDDHNDNEEEDDDDDDDDGNDFLRSIGLLDEDEDDNGNSEAIESFDDDDTSNHILGGSRYIETSKGTIDIELDDILAELQKVEFDEFIDVLKKNNHVYDKILCQQEWSGEELEFLQSIEPLIRQEKPQTPVKTEKNKSNKPSVSLDTGDNKLINTKTYETVKEMFADLSEKALILARKNQRKVQYTPKNIQKMWHIDTQAKREHRIKLMFGSNINPHTHNTLNSHTHTPRNDMSNIIYGKNEIRYQELKEILTSEIEIMTENLDDDALNFIRQDGKRFSFQFIDFLVQKYGTKIYYLYQSQLKNDISADRLSDDLTNILGEYLSLHDAELFFTDFFEGIIITLEKKGLLF